MTIDQLDPTIKEVAEAYGFEISHLDLLDKVTIKAEEMNCYFSWSSEKTKADFFRELKSYFMKVSSEPLRSAVKRAIDLPKETH